MIEVSDLKVRYGTTEAVKGVCFSLGHGETLGIVGESGSGKSTIAKTLIGLEKPFSGRIVCNAKSVQMVFQDAVGSLNPRMTVRQTLEETLKVKRTSKRSIGELLDFVGLSSGWRKTDFKRKGCQQMSRKRKQIGSKKMQWIIGLLVAVIFLAAVGITAGRLMEFHQKQQYERELQERKEALTEAQ